MRILIINPNSDDAFSADMQACARQFADGRFEVDACSVPTAPKFLVTEYDKSLCVPGMVQIIQQQEARYDAFIIAAFGDPALHMLREITVRPVLGIGECSMKLASMLGASFSILTFYPRSYAMLKEQVEQNGMGRYLASIRALEQDRPELAYDERFYDIGYRAVHEDLAEVLILGCGGLTNGVDRALSERLHVPVLDSLICALIVASGMAQYGLQTSKAGRYQNGY